MDAPFHIHGRSHSFPFIHPREVFLAWHWVIARPLSSHGTYLAVTPSGSRQAWLGWNWYIHPILGGHPHTRECQLLMQWGGVGCNVECMNFCAGFSLHMRGCLLQSDTLPQEACPPIYPWPSSSLERQLPWLGQDHQVSNLWHQSSSHNTSSIFELLL